MPNKYCACAACAKFTTEDIDRLRFITVMSSVFENFMVAHIVKRILGPNAPIDDTIHEIGVQLSAKWLVELGKIRARLDDAKK